MSLIDFLEEYFTGLDVDLSGIRTVWPYGIPSRSGSISLNGYLYYFRYLYGRGGQYELYGENAYADLIEPELPDFVSETFESLCHQAVPALYADYQLTQMPSQWWYKGREIDVVAPTDESTLIAGEAKFTNTPLGYHVLADLEDDVEHIDWTPTTGGEPTYELALFSRSGFKRSVEEAADERDDLRLFDLPDIVAVLENRA